MNHHEPRLRRGAHRTGHDLAAAVVPSLLAVASVAALVTALYVWRGEADAEPAPTAATSSPTPTASITPTPTPTPTPSDSSPTPTSSSPSPEESKTTPELTTLEVVVLNQTARGGLAAVVAEELRGKGFDVVATGNFRGIVPATTVYYPDGTRADARQVARALPTAPRVRPRFSNLSTTRLTIVLTDSYPSST